MNEQINIATKKVVVAVFSLLVSFSVYADKYTTGVTIGSIETLSNGKFLITSKNDILTSGYYVNGRVFKVYITNNSTESETDLTESSAKNFLSVALSAFAMGNTIDIYHGETGNCLVTRLKISK